MSEIDRKLAQQNRIRALVEKREIERFQATPDAIAELDFARIQQTHDAVQRALQSVETQAQMVENEQGNYKTLTRAVLHESNKHQTSKAIASTFYGKIQPAHDERCAANIHHTGSHYVMAGSKQFQKGVRVKGVVSRHSKQAAKRNGQNMKNGVHNKTDGSMSILT